MLLLGVLTDVVQPAPSGMSGVTGCSRRSMKDGIAIGLSFTLEKAAVSAPRAAARPIMLVEAVEDPCRAVGDVGSPLLAVFTRFPAIPAKRM